MRQRKQTFTRKPALRSGQHVIQTEAFVTVGIVKGVQVSQSKREGPNDVKLTTPSQGPSDEIDWNWTEHKQHKQQVTELARNNRSKSINHTISFAGDESQALAGQKLTGRFVWYCNPSLHISQPSM